jgi:malonate-semialdehyde dehydrogenase (acetylating) / methylmalonate-semialdehyde dehydrogenase
VHKVNFLTTLRTFATMSKLQQAAVDSGASLALDGRNVHPAGFEKGNFLGPTVLIDVAPGSPAHLEEIFGPVLSCMTVDSLEAAIELVNSCKYGNGTAISHRAALLPASTSMRWTWARSASTLLW